ncbi:hypothetical protein [Marinobacter oulmenensis]|uniref:DNA repair exonuclease SbcCD ATPase subunit n=1 Tax=Marinobacter oulmenensis TaxID=643747 RepID=A0A840UNY1_9GAMM|nr:hypothetical protein [Marinobacter oulmenensis]MBB5322338.1 DNA repair exonuclease SbcCD ATPase subunit [Marinobacter oulmenensis]
MANQKQEVELLIKAGTEGLKSLGQLVKELESLGEDTSEASEKLEGLAGALDELRSQQKLVRQFADLKSQTKDLADQQATAKERATELGRALAQTEKPTRAQRNEFEKAKKAARQAEDAWQDNQRQLNGLRDSLGEAGISTRDLASEQQRIKREIAGVDEEVGSVTHELSQMRDNARAAARSSRELGEETEGSGKKVKKFRERLKGLSPILGKVGSGLKTAGLAVTGFVAAAGASAATMTIFSKGQAELADELTNTSNALGESRKNLQLWRIAGDRVGLSGEKVTDILRNVTERLGEFSRTGGGEAVDVMDTLNLKIEEFRNLSPAEQMQKLGQAIGSLSSKSEQVALLEKLASDASQLQPLLDDNAAGLRAIFEQAEQEGAIYSEEELSKLNRANDIYNDIDLKIRGLTARVGAELAPVVADATNRIVDLFDQSEGGEKLVSLFRRLSESAVGFVERLSDNSDSLGDKFSTLTSTLSFLGNTATAVFRGAQAAAAYFLTFLATGIAGVMTAVQGLALALNKVGAVSDSAYRSIAAKAEAARASVMDLQAQTLEYGAGAAEAAKAAVNAFNETESAAKKSAEEVEAAAGTLTTLPEDIKSAAQAGEEALKRQSEEARRARDELGELGVDSSQVLTGVANDARASIDSLGEMANKIAEAGYEGEEAAKLFQNGFEQALEKINSKEGLQALQSEIESLAESGQIGSEGAAKALEKVRQKLVQLKLSGDDAGGGLKENLKGVEEEGKKASEAVDDVGDSAEDSGNKAAAAFDWFGAVLTAARTAVTKLSKSARNLFENEIGSNAFVQEAESAREALFRVDQELTRVQSSLNRVGAHEGFTRWALETEEASLRVQRQFWSQAAAMENLVDRVNSGSYSMQELDNIAARANDRFDLLDSQRLAGLQSAIDSARSKMESLKSSAESALNSLRQRLADISGDTEEAQRLQYEAERQRLEEERDRARKAGADEAAADYQNALDTLEQIYKVEQQNRKEEQNEREKKAADRAREQEMAELERQNARRSNKANPPANQQVSTQPVKTINVNLGGETFRVVAEDDTALLNALEKARGTAA